MKRIKAFLISIILVVLFLIFANNYLRNDITKNYYDKMGNIVNPGKYESIILQQEATKKEGTLFLLGSSEVGGTKSKDPYHPSNIFSNKKDGFQVELIGRGHYQSIVHTLNVGALGRNLSGEKVVLIVSPQWFDRQGLTPQNLNMNFSEEQFYGFMFNKNISTDLKKEVAKRLLRLIPKDTDYNGVRELCYIISKDNKINKVRSFIEAPYFRARFYMLKLRDCVQAEKIIGSSGKEYRQNETGGRTRIDWNSEFSGIRKFPKESMLGFDQEAFNKLYKNRLGLIKGHYKFLLSQNSPEYTDFRLLLSTFKQLGIKPLIVDLPMDGKWYDYCGISKADRSLYYDKINTIVKSYGFDLFDMSGYEYTEHIFKDPYHIEGKGWIYIDEAIDKYYHGGYQFY